MPRQTLAPSKFMLTMIMLIIASTVSAQTPPSPNQKALDAVALPKLLPASPEPTAFLRAAFANTNMSTGAASAEIPLYTIKIRDFSFPISLSYSTQGLKADEPVTRTGLGWVLNATGMVTRNVKGIPDESAGVTQRTSPPTGFPGTWNMLSSALFGHYNQVATQPSSLDTEADEFNFHINGHKGSFVLDNTFQPKATTATNAMISVGFSPSAPISGITITTEDGVTYHFGNAAANAYEQTTTTTMAQFKDKSLNTRTAYFLDQITLVTGEQINFVYGPNITYQLITGTTQTLTVIPPGGMQYAQNSYSDQQDKVTYVTHAIQSIQTSDGRAVNFTYSGTGLDMNLSGIDVVDTGTAASPVHLKTYGFQYYVVPNPPGVALQPRFFLTRITDTTGPALYHDFAYNDLANVPRPPSLSQDFGGFYNGRNSAFLIPSTVGSDGQLDLSFRAPGPDAAMKGTLSSITYPTGGKQEFFYEANTITEYKSRTVPDVNYNLDGPGGGSAGSYSQIMYTNNNVTVPYTQTVTIECWAEDAMADYPADTQHENVAIWVFEGATLIGSRSSLGLNSVSSTTITLQAGHTYSFQMKANHYTEICHGRILYKKFQQTAILDTLTTIVPGIRVREIRSADQFTGTTNSKYYTYATLGDLKHSSGTGGGIPTAVTTQHMRIYSENGVQVADFDQTIYSSSTMRQVYSLTGSPVYYNTVIESDDPDFANGGTEYTFYGYDGGSSTAQLLGASVPFVGGGQYPTLTGEVHFKKAFDKSKTIVQLEETNWEVISDDTPAAGMPLSYHVRKNFSANGSDINVLNSFDVTQVEYGVMWNRIKYKETTTYVSGVEYKERTDYLYRTDRQNLLPDSVIVNDSRDLNYATSIQYPNTTKVNDIGYSILVGENRLNVPVYKAEYYNNILQQQERTYYMNVSPAMEQRIQLQSNPSDVLDDEVLFNSYDSYQHPASVQKVSDVEFTYLWDTRLHQPIAEVKNASPANIAFSSFEDGATGNWTLTGSTSTAQAYTGTQSFIGTLTKSVAQGVYTVSMWVYGSVAPTVNGSTGSTVRSSNGWNLQQWRVNMTTAGTITVNSQSQNVDEVRLHPEGAEMVTYTYFPFIGTASKIDLNQRASFYEYDSSHRLSAIRDQDNNVIKTFDYHYAQEN